ncbi:MAG: aminopeptidase N [Phenylobacterium sp.]|uniref:aminopeptidase N n=1 Tax=Phenylobacterium sp. TaxID=1871053 RepID=UPI0025F2AD5D|nr:aminopeptidase N [Phenylobacterium sp.]MCA3712923.1 aminopeptidase N [Phenylobacterium sp.]MCA3724474.1 aminopeptidase N [Phenylobacterium sp.]MCA3725108.1 aminopeptidase N [Phenylobacterium sp.]MCA3728823.1 aminopeptidase N [Phenylobacterium sp.]MCA3738915.1 aminopeptidase N [Phenylobacterium sp.]
MRTETPALIRLADYTPPAFLVDEVHLDFDLQPEATRVKARLSLRRNGPGGTPLQLDGERLKTLSVAVDGRVLGPGEFTADGQSLTIPGVPNAFALETEVEINPAANKALEGLYMSGGRFCTQCEAEGFRTITWYPDRPDVLARFTVRMTADDTWPLLLSNGNLVETGRGTDGRRYAVWNDPFPKPCYLFALVAGELDELADSFVTASGRKVELKIYVDPGMSARAAYAMDALKRSMRWDEEAFGREYDLDLFMIVAVRDFNFGAMENKGLNIFNSSLLLADPETATDLDYERIESVVAHEYFHNWTGNRITCRDWFQLCLKEGLTVFRDQSFSADMRGEAVQRIKDVKALRARQFAEDQGPLAHPVRPSSYLKIDNFYTATIYEKGAEVIRMLKALIGAEAFRKGMDLYFERWDGHATTVEAFIACFAEVSGQDLSAFFAWYEQAGTPRVRLASRWTPETGELEITLTQRTPATPGQADKRALPVPVRLGLLDAEGRTMAFTRDGEAQDETLVVLEGEETRLTLSGVTSRPVVSALRGFSAPVELSSDARPGDRYVQLAGDADLFNRWEAGQEVARDLILARAGGAPDEVGEERFAEAMGRALNDQASEPAFKALLLSLPTESDLAVARPPADPAAIHEARQALRLRLAVHLEETLKRLHLGLQDGGEFSPDAASAGRRALRNAALEALAANPQSEIRALAEGHYRAAGNMTDAIGGLNALMTLGGAGFASALEDFHTRWRNEPLVIDKWFALQARDSSPEALERVITLTRHPDFDAQTPNRLRALVATFATANPARFHARDGSGYRFLADQILAVDRYNPMTAARLVEPLGSWRRYRPDLGAKMKAELERIAAAPGLSRNVLELVGRALDG